MRNEATAAPPLPPEAAPNAPGSGTPSGPKTRRVWAAALGGALGGAVGGVLGGAFGSTIQEMDLPEPTAALRGAIYGLIGLGLLGAGAGALAGLLVRSRAGSRTVFAWLTVAACIAALVAAVETYQNGPLIGLAQFALGLTELVVACVLLGPVCRLFWKVRWLLLAWLGLCLIGAGYGRFYPPTFPPLALSPAEPIVQLRCAPLPDVLGYVAEHHWFLEFDPDEGRWHRWELWQDADCPVLPGGASWGHVHKDLGDVESGVNGYPPRIVAEWRGQAARDLRAALAASPDYPYRGRYLAWPGPNSNTYIAWVLRRAGVPVDLGPLRIGTDYLGRLGGVAVSTTRTGLQAETPVRGGKVGPLEGVEIHFLCFTLGIDTWPPAVKTPLGRVGFPE
jgi:hypothetical protein